MLRCQQPQRSYEHGQKPRLHSRSHRRRPQKRPLRQGHNPLPPEPNAYLHIGSAKAISINFGIAADYQGQCNLRYDDTNPTREEQEYVDSMQEDIRWLGFDWGPQPYYASDYFGQLYEWAVVLIKKGLAYVDDQTADEIRENRGTLNEPGKNSPYRDRPIEENLHLFEQMKNGAFPDGSRVLRAKIDMTAPNINLRDPVMYRIMHTTHHRTGDAWCIYPLYDWAHGQSDSIEGVTHSLCSDEFINNRPLYDWFIQQLGIFPSRQIEFARGNITYTVLSKRYIRPLIEQTASVRLGRSSALHLARPAPLGLPARSHPPLLGRSGHRSPRQQHRHFPPRILHPRPAQQDRAPAHGRAQPAQGRH